MGKCGAKVGPVNVRLPGALGKIQTVAARTKHIDGKIAWHVRETNRQNGLPLTKDVGAATEMSHAIFFVHSVHASVGSNVAIETREKEGTSEIKKHVRTI